MNPKLYLALMVLIGSVALPLQADETRHARLANNPFTRPEVLKKVSYIEGPLAIVAVVDQYRVKRYYEANGAPFYNDRAISFAVDRLSTQYSQDFSKLVHKYALAGDPAHCQARLREYIDAGASTIVVSSACPDDYIDTNLEMTARQVIPAFRP